MDVDYFNSGTESAQIDLMTMMMDMEKPPLQPSAVSPTASSLPFNGHHHDIFTPSSLTNCYYSPAADPQSVGCGLPSVAAMREMIFHIAAMQPIHIDPESVRPPKRRNVRISKDPQSVAARHRRERISERIRILQQLVPGGTKMDTASMLDEAIHYMKFLKGQVQALERAAAANRPGGATGAPAAAVAGWFGGLSYAGFDRSCDQAWERGFPVNTTSSSSDAN